MQNSLGEHPHTYRRFFGTLQDGRDTAYRNLLDGVHNRLGCWKREARQIYGERMDAHSQLVEE
jgi:hypothetical protein